MRRKDWIPEHNFFSEIRQQKAFPLLKFFLIAQEVEAEDFRWSMEAEGSCLWLPTSVGNHDRGQCSDPCLRWQLFG